MKVESETATPRAGGIPVSPPRTEARRDRVAFQVPDLLAAGAVLMSGVLLLHWLSRITFWRDEWGILLHRRGWGISTFLDPAVEHLVALPILIYKVLLSTAGMDSPLPFQVVAVFTFLLSVVLLFIYVRARVGAWLALAAILPVLFLGPSWDDLLFPYQMTLFGSMACGIGALLALERRGRGSDVVATVLLIGSLLFSDLGIPFVAGAVVEVALDRERFRRAFAVAVPTVLWLLWYVGWGHNAHTFISFHNFANLPSYVVDGLGSSLASLLGLGVPLGTYQMTSLDWGRPLLVLVVGLAALRIYRVGRPSDRALATLAVLLGFWCLTALDASPLGLPTAGRYQYIGIVLLLLFAADFVTGMQIRHWAVVALVFVSFAAALTNFSRLRDAAHGLAGIGERERGGLAGLELTRNRVPPQFQLTQENSGVDYLGFLDARSYFSAVDAYGSPAYSESELAASSETARAAADNVSASAMGLRLAPAPYRGHGPCASLQPGRGPTVLRLPSGGVLLRTAVGGSQVSLRRYASTSYPVALGALAVGRAQVLNIPDEGSARPWWLQLSGGGIVSACRMPSP